MAEFWGPIVKPLLEAIQAKIIVEVGAFEGQNTAHLLTYCAEQNGHLHVIDPLPQFDAKAYQQKFGPHFSMHRQLSLHALAELHQFDAILLDCYHKMYNIFNELKQIETIHRDNVLTYPVIFLHNVAWPYGRRNGVLTAVKDFMAQSGLDFEFSTISVNFGLGILVTRQRLQHNPQLRQCLEVLQAIHLPATLREAVAWQSALPYHVNLRDSLAPHFLQPSLERQAQEGKAKPTFSIIVVVYNMRREAERTLYSLSAQYQQEVDAADYEVIVVENGSTEPLENADLSRFGENFTYYYLPNAPTSPVHAINVGAALARGDYLGIMIDGAHLLTPGVLKYAQLGFQLFKNPIIVIRHCFLGPNQQNVSILHGYNKQVEDALLDQIGWPEQGYRLFDIGELIGTPRWHWFEPVVESNCLFVKRQVFADLGGYDEKFDLPAGGFASPDFFVRSLKHPDAALVVVLGEASFHQMHHGTTTNAHQTETQRLLGAYLEQYRAIRGTPFAIPDVPLHFIGHMSPQAIVSGDRVANREYDLIFKEMQEKEKEIQQLAQICAEREALINQLSVVCAERQALINQLSVVRAERQAGAKDA